MPHVDVMDENPSQSTLSLSSLPSLEMSGPKVGALE